MEEEKVVTPKKVKRLPKEHKQLDYSKRLISDVRGLLWAVTLGGIFLAFYCIYKGYVGSLPWVGAMVGLPWTAHGTICAFYLNMAKSDHSEGGITFEAAKATGFMQDSSIESDELKDWESLPI